MHSAVYCNITLYTTGTAVLMPFLRLVSLRGKTNVKQLQRAVPEP